MTKEKNKDFYMLPGGRLEEGESLGEALMREAYEELGTGVSIEDISLYEIYELPGKAEGDLMEFNVYEAKLKGNFEAKGEIEDIRWVNTKDVKRGVKIGSITSMKLFPQLKKEKLID